VSIKESSERNNDEIDLRLILSFLLRNKYFLIIGVILGFIFGSTKYAFTPKIWQGEFEIVIAKNDLPNELKSASGLINDALKGQKNNEIDTQIIILESPSVLMDTFNYVKDINKEVNLNFVNWKKRLNVKQINDSSVLRIKYSDQNRAIILPVLDKVAKLYEDYNNTKRLKSIDLKINYYKDQIKKYTYLASKSLLDTQTFSDKFAISQKIGEGYENTLITDVESNATSARIKLKEVNQRLKKIKEIEDNEEFIYYAKLFNLSTNILNELNKIDSNIESYSTQFTNNDPILINLNNQRELLKDKLGKEIIRYLESDRDAAEITLSANKRDPNVIFNFKNLLLESSKNSETLKNLEKQLLIMELEKARDSEPWDLITRPTQLPYPIAPSFAKHSLAGSAILFLFLTFLLFFKEKNKKYITTIEEIKSLLNINNSFLLSLKDEDNFYERLDLAKIYLKNKSKNKITLYGPDIPESIINKIINYLNKNKTIDSYFLAKKISDFSNTKKLVVIVSLNQTTKISISKLISNLEIFEIELLALIVIDNGKVN